MTNVRDGTAPLRESVFAGYPVLDADLIDHYMRRGRKVRARAFAEWGSRLGEKIRGILRGRKNRPAAEIHELPPRQQPADAPVSETGQAARPNKAA